MTKKSVFKIFLHTFSGLVLLSACKVNKDDSKGSGVAPGVLLSYFISEQAAFNNSTYAQQLYSKLWGQAFLATSNSTFKNWEDPTMGCRFLGQDGVAVELTRNVDVGSLSIKDSANQLTEVTQDPKSFFFQLAYQLFNPGQALLTTSGAQDASLKLNQPFFVPENGSNIKIKTASSEYTLPSPKIINPPTDPAQDTEGFYVQLSRDESFELSSTAPSGTDYVRLTVSESPTPTSQSVVCYAKPNEKITMPAGALSQMRTGQDALLTLDFISKSVIKNTARFKENIVVSYKRHYHGRKDYSDPETGAPKSVYLGALILY